MITDIRDPPYNYIHGIKHNIKRVTGTGKKKKQKATSQMRTKTKLIIYLFTVALEFTPTTSEEPLSSFAGSTTQHTS